MSEQDNPEQLAAEVVKIIRKTHGFAGDDWDVKPSDDEPFGDSMRHVILWQAEQLAKLKNLVVRAPDGGQLSYLAIRERLLKLEVERDQLRSTLDQLSQMSDREDAEVDLEEQVHRLETLLGKALAYTPDSYREPILAVLKNTVRKAEEAAKEKK